MAGDDLEEQKESFLSYAINLISVQNIQKGESAHSLFLELSSICSSSEV